MRCIAAVLLMVGAGAEKPAIVTELLDVTRHPAKPQYHMASEKPLLLSGAGYRPGELDALSFSDAAAAHVLRRVTALTEEAEVKLGLLHSVRDEVARLHAGGARGDRGAQVARVAEPQAAAVGVGAESASSAQNGAVGACVADAAGKRNHTCDSEAREQESAHATTAAPKRPAHQKSKKQRKLEGPRVNGQPHIPLLQRATEPTFEARLAAARARGLVAPAEAPT